MRAGTIQMQGLQGGIVDGMWWATPRGEASRLLRWHAPTLRLGAPELAALLDGEAWLVVVRIEGVTCAEVCTEGAIRLAVGRLAAGVSPRVPGARRKGMGRTRVTGVVAA